MLSGPVQMHARRLWRATQQFGHLANRAILQVEKHHRCALTGRKSADRLPDIEIPLRYRPRRLRRSALGNRIMITPLERTHGEPDRHPPHPRARPVVPRDLAPCAQQSQEGLLRDLFGHFTIVDDEEHRALDSRELRDKQLIEAWRRVHHALTIRPLDLGRATHDDRPAVAPA